MENNYNITEVWYATHGGGQMIDAIYKKDPSDQPSQTEDSQLVATIEE